MLDSYNKEGLAQAFVKFLEKESQPRLTNHQNTSTLLNIVQSPSNRSSPTSSEQTTLAGVATSSSRPSITSPAASTSSSQSTPVAVLPILLNNEGLLQNFAPPRNSSSILKDILNDS